MEENKTVWEEAYLDAVAGQIRAAADRKTYIRQDVLREATELDEESFGSMMTALLAGESWKDIRAYQTGKNVYYYSSLALADNYIRHLVSSSEDSLAETIAQTARYDSRVYPRPTPAQFLARFPYHYTRIQVQNALKSMERLSEYSDIHGLVSPQGQLYFYSSLYLNERRARLLIPEFGADPREDH